MIPSVGFWRFSVPRLITRAWAARVLLVQVHATVAAVAVACVLLLPRWYTSSVTLVPSSRDGLSLDLTGGGAPFAGSMFGLGSGPTPQDQLRAVIRSRAVADSLVLRFGLRERWRLQRHEDARRALAHHTTITTPREGEVHIDVEARDPVLARDLAAGYARYGGSESIRLKASLATQRRTYLEGHMAEVEREILAASARLRSFEEEHGAVSLPDQARETIDAYGTLRAQRAMLQTELVAARRWFADSAPEVRTLQDRIGELDRQLGDMAVRGGPLQPSGQDLPALRQQFLERSREEASVIAVAELLRRAREQARVEEANPVPAFSVLDAADLPERHSRPQRGLTVLLSLALCAAGSVGWLWWSDPEHAVRAPELEPVNERSAA
jgi:uncharacterized protein involved in exopolysaccharide biosynthesis